MPAEQAESVEQAALAAQPDRAIASPAVAQVAAAVPKYSAAQATVPRPETVVAPGVWRL